jgi:dCMP deaminase
MKDKYKGFYMGIARDTAQLSTARKKRVGAVVVKDDRIISVGYNGTPSGWDNNCEEWKPYEGVTFHVAGEDLDVYGEWHTKPEVLHAEANAITKLARSTESGEDSSMFVTHVPCIECAKLIYQSGVKEVYYDEEYVASKGSGKQFLIECGIKLEKLDE